MYAPYTHKIALAYCDRLTPLEDVISIFKKLSENNPLVPLKVAMVCTGPNISDKVEKILAYIEEHNNIKIEFRDTYADPCGQELAIDTEGNFSTDCNGIGVDFNALPNFQVITEQMIKLNEMEVTGIEFPLFSSDY